MKVYIPRVGVVAKAFKAYKVAVQSTGKQSKAKPKPILCSIYTAQDRVGGRVDVKA